MASCCSDGRPRARRKGTPFVSKAVQIRQRLQALNSSIVRAFPEAVLGDIEDESSIALSSTSVHLPNRVHLSVANDIDHPETKFMVMRVGHSFPDRLPFEQAFEDGFGLSEQLDADAVFALMRKYAELPRSPASLH
jgi:hypothetical protein